MLPKRKNRQIIDLKPINRFVEFLFQADEHSTIDINERATLPPTPIGKDVLRAQMEMIRGESSLVDRSLIPADFTLSELGQDILETQAEFALRRKSFEELAEQRFEPVDEQAIFQNFQQTRLEKESETIPPFNPKGARLLRRVPEGSKRELQVSKDFRLRTTQRRQVAQINRQLEIDEEAIRREFDDENIGALLGQPEPRFTIDSGEISSDQSVSGVMDSTLDID